MSLLRLSKSQIAKLMTDISQKEDLTDAFSRAVWSLITEPGDTFAAALIGTLGATRALEAEVAKFSGAKYLSLLREVTLDSDVEQRFTDFARLLSDARERWQPRLKLNSVEQMLQIARHCKAKISTPSESDWPKSLNDLGLGVPHALWQRGNSGAMNLNPFAISIVGSRMATSYGEWVASEVAMLASAGGISVISGGAYGIDAIAHRSALINDGNTVAVMAGGVDRLYPSGNTDLLTRIIQAGAVISEQAPGSNPTKWRFLQRNRLIAALGNATIIVEAGKRSGAINTAHHAEALTRPIGVIPGPINSAASLGCLNLLREDPSRLLTSVQDAVSLVTGDSEPELFEDLPIGPLETRALDAMNRSSLIESEIAHKAGLTSRELGIALGRLQMLGLVAQRGRGWSKLT